MENLQNDQTNSESQPNEEGETERPDEDLRKNRAKETGNQHQLS